MRMPWAFAACLTGISVAPTTPSDRAIIFVSKPKPFPAESGGITRHLLRRSG
jgi:hypothetical protein